MHGGKFVVRPVVPQDQNALAGLIHFERLVHRHLDWRMPLDWIGSQPFLAVEQKGILVGALACPPDPPGVAWIRLLAVSADIQSEMLWELLWSEARVILKALAQPRPAALSLQQWFSDLLLNSGFQWTQDVIMLSWDQHQPLPARSDRWNTLRSMTHDDLVNVQMLDELAFEPIWRHSLQDLETAFYQASLATVIEDESGLLGYQISTSGSFGAHLARLAVRRDMQGLGIGKSLLVDLLDQFTRRGVPRVTVNTQSDNIASLALYKKAGFVETGEIYPVFQYSWF
jgi:ribosomal-protein-alanine N-acetyltransferase